MAYNEDLEKRLDFAIGVFPKKIADQISKKKMFGGLAYLFKDKMTVGIVKNDLMVRILGSKMDNILKMENVRPMDFAKRPMKEFVYVSAKGYDSEEQLQHWIELGLEHAQDKLRNGP
ncbi:MAG: TfoX/Sxy family protein [Maribacter sp.]|uniref:TfoX/Sxy family protein n=1 Tax=Maribacter sp. TaxID=1897614 RepID=UPI003C74FC2E